jgi:hypothetical protein
MKTLHNVFTCPVRRRRSRQKARVPIMRVVVAAFFAQDGLQALVEIGCGHAVNLLR